MKSEFLLPDDPATKDRSRYLMARFLYNGEPFIDFKSKKMLRKQHSDVNSSCCLAEDKKSHSKTYKEIDKLLLYIHGGGFMSGDSFGTQHFVRKWVIGLGIPCISIDYRLAPEYPFPTAFNDSFQAYYWIINYAKQHLGFNPKQIFLIGESAGGHICVSLTTLCLLKGITPPSAI